VTSSSFLKNLVQIRRSLRSRKEDDFLEESLDLQSLVARDVCSLWGGLLYFVGTVFYAVGPVKGGNTWWYVAIAMWMTGSVFYLGSAFFLGYRHFHLRLL